MKLVSKSGYYYERGPQKRKWAGHAANRHRVPRANTKNQVNIANAANLVAIAHQSTTIIMINTIKSIPTISVNRGKGCCLILVTAKIFIDFFFVLTYIFSLRRKRSISVSSASSDAGSNDYRRKKHKKSKRSEVERLAEMERQRKQKEAEQKVNFEKLEITFVLRFYFLNFLETIFLIL